MQISERINILVGAIGPLLLKRGWMIAVAESCTGGGVMHALTRISGCSSWVDSGLVTYSNDAKKDLLGVSEDILSSAGAVSAQCALAMVAGIRPKTQHLLRLATTGIAGPTGGTLHKPVGTVFISVHAPNQNAHVQQLSLTGTREEICQQSIFYAIRDLVLMSLDEESSEFHCFYALMIDDSNLQNACHNYGLRCGIGVLNLEPKCNLHVTLAYLGKTKKQDIQYLLDQGKKAASRISPFFLKFGSLTYWQRVQSYILEFQDIPSSLSDLSTFLGASTLTPHVTLSKRNPEMNITFHEGLQKEWRVSHFSLMMSFKGVFYKELCKWQFEQQE